MTIAANRPAPVLTPGAAQDTLREMAAVIRTVFGVGLQASRDAAAVAAAAPQPTMSEVEAPAVTTGSIPVPGVPASIPLPEATTPAPASIPMPTSIPLPDVPEAAVEETPASYAVEAPTVAAIAVPPLAAPVSADMSNERRNAVLQELAFLDD
jgi:hypothetical protein